MQVEKLWQFPIKEFHRMPRGILGPGAYEMVGVEAKKLGFKRSLLATSGLRGTGIVEDIPGKVKYQGVDVVVYDKIESNPKDYNCMEMADLYVKEKCDSFISVGGGSVTDATKGARIVVAHDGRNINEFDGFNKSENPDNPPHIAINTTAGTGSETSWAYVITDTTSEKAPYKWLGFDDNCPVTLGINDPVLFFSMPQDLTAFCGFDVLAHASEPYVSRLDFLPSLGSALKAIEVVAQNLRRTVFEPLNYEARYNMMYASYMAAQSFNSGGLGIIHAMSHAVSAYYDTHHGLNNAIALTRVWEYNMPTNYKRFRDIARAHGRERRRPDRRDGGRAGAGGRDPAEQGRRRSGQFLPARRNTPSRAWAWASTPSGAAEHRRRRSRRRPHHQAPAGRRLDARQRPRGHLRRGGADGQACPDRLVLLSRAQIRRSV